jgi:predicted SnoaL-like aldol condensation-catalyzing enzyme
MMETPQERNKALVLDAFDTLFNKRDYDAAARYWSPTYIQHSAHIAPGRAGLFDLIKSIAADIVRVADGMLAEHWDVLQDEATEAESRSGLPMFGARFSPGTAHP